jgi:hypothetical protein
MSLTDIVALNNCIKFVSAFLVSTERPVWAAACTKC